MGRGKLRVHLIPHEKARREGFKKRMKALEKAAHVLSTRCGVDIGMIIYGPALGDKKNFADPPTVWPKNQESVVARLIESYKSRSGCNGSGGPNNNRYDLSDYFKEKTKQAEDDLKKLREKTRISEPVKYPMPSDGHCCRYNCTSLEELKQFHGGLTAKIDAVRERINLMKESIMSQYYSVDNQESGVAYYAPPQQSAWQWNYGDDDQMSCYNEYSSIPGNMDDEMMMMTAAYNTENINNIDMSNFFDENFLSNDAYGFGTGTTMADVMNIQQMMSYNNDDDAQYIEPLSVIWNEDF
ncbi:hypothetical protein OROGR_008628 [Orobanche gracilis]